MDFHLERKIVLETESEFKSLYDWSLQELDEDGNKAGRPQIPWPWSLDFRATEIKLINVLSSEPEFRLERDENDDKLITTSRRQIKVQLKSGLPHMGRTGRGASYSMFGTNRQLNDISLTIEPTNDEKHLNRCQAWGCPSYTTEIDFRDETVDDCLVFSLHVSQEAFDGYAATIANQSVDEVFLYVRFVEGLYSEWSPAITTDAVKVLTSDKDQIVSAPNGCEITPRRLGKVGEVHLHWNKKAMLAYPSSEPDAEPDDWDVAQSEDEERQAAISTVSRTIQSDDRLVNLVSSLRNAAWIIAALLLVILIT